MLLFDTYVKVKTGQALESGAKNTLIICSKTIFLTFSVLVFSGNKLFKKIKSDPLDNFFAPNLTFPILTYPQN